uniref:Reverse transcriptase zinc-binding domain-containing protein n=1 Tax=Triticum urartu TaxID=4572 RepID=A0A8R7UTU1_TRIUA
MKPHPIWGKIWGLNVPAKVKNFLWRAMHNTIPCRVTLANRHIKVSGQCPVCEIGAEDIKHLLFKCTRGKHVWEALGIHDL